MPEYSKEELLQRELRRLEKRKLELDEKKKLSIEERQEWLRMPNFLEGVQAEINILIRAQSNQSTDL